MKFTKTLNIFLATTVFTSATANENQDPARGGLRGNREFSEEERILNPWSSTGRDILCGNGKVGNGYCPDKACCSKHGYCGDSDDHCLNSAPGFFPRLGDDEEPNCGNGEVGNGRCADGSYCSKHGWCGNKEAHYDQPAPNANLQLFHEAAFMSQKAYFVFKNHPDSKRQKPLQEDPFGNMECLGPDGMKLDYCKWAEGESDAALVTKYRNKCFVSFRGTIPLLTNAIGRGVTKENWKQWGKDALQNTDRDISINDEECTYRAGYDKSYQETKDFLKLAVSECQDECGEFGKYGCEVVLTGHSKGGAVALAASFDSDPTMKELFNDPFVVTFGAPPLATRKSQCEDSINDKKHFRIVTSRKQENNEWECDPITEHSVKTFKATVGIKGKGILSSHEFVIKDENSRETFHMGNVVLLNRDDDRSYQIAQGSGDDTCTDATFKDRKYLDPDDFLNGACIFDAVGITIGECDEDKEQPLHNVGTYKDRLESIMEGKKDGHGMKVVDGFSENHVCTKDWQCAGNMECDNKSCQ